MTEEVVNQEEQAQAQLSLQDIATAVQIIDICSRRGGFEGTELSAVGGLRERFASFIQASQQAGEAAPEGVVPEAESNSDDSDS